MCWLSEETMIENEALGWVREVNKRSPWAKFNRDDYDDYLESNLTIGEWLHAKLFDPAFLEEDYPYKD